MEQFVKRALMRLLIIIVPLTIVFVRILFNGQFLQTQLKAKLSDGIKAKDFSLPQCKEAQRLTMTFKMI
jgi:hypothetical protein